MARQARAMATRRTTLGAAAAPLMARRGTMAVALQRCRVT